jgi:hypothetical protein
MSTIVENAIAAQGAGASGIPPTTPGGSAGGVSPTTQDVGGSTVATENLSKQDADAACATTVTQDPDAADTTTTTQDADSGGTSTAATAPTNATNPAALPVAATPPTHTTTASQDDLAVFQPAGALFDEPEPLPVTQGLNSTNRAVTSSGHTQTVPATSQIEYHVSTVRTDWVAFAYVTLFSRVTTTHFPVSNGVPLTHTGINSADVAQLMNPNNLQTNPAANGEGAPNGGNAMVAVNPNGSSNGTAQIPGGWQG